MMTGQLSNFAVTFYLAESAHPKRSDPDPLQNGLDSPTLLTHLHISWQTDFLDSAVVGSRSESWFTAIQYKTMSKPHLELNLNVVISDFF